MDFLVNPYFNLLFSREEKIKFSEVALIVVHWNCLIGCVMITRGYRSSNTVNTTADIYLVYKNSNKNTERKFKVSPNLFISYLATPRLTLAHWQRGSLTHPLLITMLFQVWPEGHREPRNEIGSRRLAERIAEFEPRTFWFWV